MLLFITRLSAATIVRQTDPESSIKDVASQIVTSLRKPVSIRSSPFGSARVVERKKRVLWSENGVLSFELGCSFLCCNAKHHIISIVYDIKDAYVQVW